MNLIFDLDGTLLDSRLRLYLLFQKLVPLSNLSFESYWAFKRNKVSNESILKGEFAYSSEEINQFLDNWMSLIEEPKFLDYDRTFPGMHVGLARLNNYAKLHICTARQYRNPVLDQLKRLDLLEFFDSVMVTEQIHSKEELISRIPDLSSEDWIIGDTGKDIQAGKIIGINTCAVISGFLSEESLLSYNPKRIIKFASDFNF